jgi:hypothetical protein
MSDRRRIAQTKDRVSLSLLVFGATDLGRGTAIPDLSTI